jgi:hypothetical protein
MSKFGLGFVILVMLVTGFFQFYITQLSVVVFTWGALGNVTQAFVLLLTVALVLKFKPSKNFRLVYFSTFILLVLFVQFYYLYIDVLVAGLLLTTSIMYLLSILCSPKYKHVLFSAYLSSLTFYLVTMIFLPFLSYLQVLPLVWEDQGLVVSQFKSQGHNIMYALYGGGPSMLAVLIGGYLAKRT